MRKWLLLAVGAIARLHEYIISLNDDFPTVLTDKQLHFLVVGIAGMLLFFVIHPIFKALAKRGHIIVVSWFYVITMTVGLTFAIEIGQQVTHTGSMEFADIVFGVMGFITMFGIFAILRAVVLVVARMRKK